VVSDCISRWRGTENPVITSSFCLSNALHSSIGQNIKSLAHGVRRPVSGVRCPMSGSPVNLGALNANSSKTAEDLKFKFGRGV